MAPSVQHMASANEISAEGRELEQVASGFEFLEGPVWHPVEKHLTFSDIVGNTMYRWSRVAGLDVYRKPSNMANCNTYDREGRLLTCEHATSRVTRTDLNGRVEVLASHYRGKELNSPNDIVVGRDGSIYFTDPISGRSATYGVLREQEQPFQGVYRLNEELSLLVDDFSKPNGLCLSLDEARLFVNDTDRNHIRVFDVQPDGSVKNGRIFYEDKHVEPGVPDGMKVDVEGNVYCTGSAGIHVIEPAGNLLGRIKVPDHVANHAWGEADWRSLYITARANVYRVRLNIPGVPHGMWPGVK